MTQAGGPGEKALLAKAYVTRDGKQLPLNLSSVQSGKLDLIVSSFKFQANDWLFVPENVIHFSVMGSVSRPGNFPVPDTGSVTVLEALNEAGGSAGGNLSKAGVVRIVNGTATHIDVNIDKMLKKSGNLADNIKLEPNDILYIPASSNHAFNWQSVLGPFSALALLGFHL
jgi:hypothetical protein